MAVGLSNNCCRARSPIPHSAFPIRHEAGARSVASVPGERKACTLVQDASALAGGPHRRYIARMKLLLENLPESLKDQADTLARCLEAFARVRPIHRVYLFGSHARGDARPDSDVDLCIVADGAERQLETATALRRSLRGIRPKPSLTLIPITPVRLREKQDRGDPFFGTILTEGLLLATEN